MTRRLRTPKQIRLLSVLAVIGLMSLVSVSYLRALTAELGPRSVTLSSDTVNATASYQLSFTTLVDDTLGSIDLQFCANDPLVNTPCTTPAGFDASGVILSAQSGATAFSVSPATTANNVILQRTPASFAHGTASYTLGAITNPKAVGSYYIRLTTYASSDASGTATAAGGLAYAITAPLSVQATVPPYLLFCAGVTITGTDCDNASGSYINFGELGTTVTKQATSQLLAATNAQSGYNVQLDGSTMTSGNNVIHPLTGDISRAGVGQFGLNLVANSSPAVGSAVAGSGTVTPTYAQSNYFRFVPGDQIAGSPTAAAAGKYTVSYIVNVGDDQASGDYVSTLTYICLANF